MSASKARACPAKPAANNCWQREWAAILCDSHLRVCGRALLPTLDEPSSLGETLFDAGIVVVSHGTEADPIFNYANRTALELFEMTWEQFVQLPSRKSAEPLERAERDRLMKAVSARGYIDDYSGIRVSATGKRFSIRNATVWNVVDDSGVLRGQAATFSSWQPVD